MQIVYVCNLGCYAAAHCIFPPKGCEHKFCFIFLSAKFFKHFLQGKLFLNFKMKMQIQFLLYLKVVWLLERGKGKEKCAVVRI